MVKNNRYSLKYRRRREGKTNYHNRIKLLAGGRPRLVIRRSNAHVMVQLVDYHPDGDKVMVTFSTQKLSSLGWKAGTKNVPAAYLAGYAVGIAAKKAGVKEAIVDIGLQKPHHKGRLFAAVKGASDAGLKIPFSSDAIPSDDRLLGTHISDDIKNMVEDVKKRIG